MSRFKSFSTVVWSVITVLIMLSLWVDPELVIIPLVIVGLYLYALDCRKKARIERTRCSTMEEIDRLNPYQFEERVGLLFKHKGYKVQVTPKSGDFGADVIAKGNGKKIAIQVKHYNNAVGVNALYSVFTAKTYYDCSDCIVVTNYHHFTKDAIKLSEKCGIELWDRQRLSDELLQQLPEPNVVANQDVAN